MSYPVDFPYTCRNGHACLSVADVYLRGERRQCKRCVNARVQRRRNGTTALVDMSWSDGAVACLRQLWAEGHSTAEIGRRLGTSKDAVVNKAHRLGLPRRPSPIKNAVTPQELERRRQAQRAAQCKKVVTVIATKPLPEPTRIAQGSIVPEPYTYDRPHSKCQWPLSNGQPWLFCDAVREECRPYCAAHMMVAVSTQREAA